MGGLFVLICDAALQYITVISSTTDERMRQCFNGFVHHASLEWPQLIVAATTDCCNVCSHQLGETKMLFLCLRSASTDRLVVMERSAERRNTSLMTNVAHFRKRLKTHLFRQSYPDAVP